MSTMQALSFNTMILPVPYQDRRVVAISVSMAQVQNGREAAQGRRLVP